MEATLAILNEVIMTAGIQSVAEEIFRRKSRARRVAAALLVEEKL